jgi:hypothetical protein
MARIVAPSHADTDPVSIAAAPALSEEQVMVIAAEKRTTLIEETKAWLATQPKRTVKVRSDGDVFVQINGYGMLIQPGVSVEVPEPVAVLLDQADYI